MPNLLLEEAQDPEHRGRSIIDTLQFIMSGGVGWGNGEFRLMLVKTHSLSSSTYYLPEQRGVSVQKPFHSVLDISPHGEFQSPSFDIVMDVHPEKARTICTCDFVLLIKGVMNHT